MSTQDLDPEVRYLSYFRDIRERRSWMARMTVLVAVIGLLGLNSYLLFLSTDAIVMNVDQARLEQSELTERLESRIDQLEADIEEITASQAAAVAVAD